MDEYDEELKELDELCEMVEKVSSECWVKGLLGVDVLVEEVPVFLSLKKFLVALDWCWVKYLCVANASL